MVARRPVAWRLRKHRRAVVTLPSTTAIGRGVDVPIAGSHNNLRFGVRSARVDSVVTYLASRIRRRGIGEKHHWVALWISRRRGVLHLSCRAGLCVASRSGTHNSRSTDLLVFSFVDSIGGVDPVDDPLGALDEGLRFKKSLLVIPHSSPPWPSVRVPHLAAE